MVESIGSENTPNLEELWLFNTNITDKSAFAIANAIKSGNFFNANIRGLPLYFTNIGDKGAKSVIDAVASSFMPKLEIVSLSDSLLQKTQDYIKEKLGDKVEFIQTKEENLTFADEAIDSLSKNWWCLYLAPDATNKSAFSIANLIKNGKLQKLERLDLSFTKIDDEGLRVLIDAMIIAGKNNQLQDFNRFYLDNIPISDVGVVYLKSVVKDGNFPHLEVLDL